MADAEGVLEARSVSEMPAERATIRAKSIKGADNLGWGMRNRLSRLIGRDGHCQFLPITATSRVQRGVSNGRVKRSRIFCRMQTVYL